MENQRNQNNRGPHNLGGGNVPTRGPRSLVSYLMMPVIALGVFLFMMQGNTEQQTLEEIHFVDFIQLMEEGYIEEINVRPVTGDGNRDLLRVSGEKTVNGEDGEFYLIVHQSHIALITEMAIYHNVDMPMETLPAMPWTAFISFAVTGVLVIVVITMMRSTQRGNNKAFNFGNNRAQLAKDSGVSFKDVAGNEEEKEELVEIVDFLKSPKKYNDMGARIPKGVLLTGPPGTGKTLLARAVAGEAGAPFYSISGSDFMEMFVGVGASRVRDMFAVAKKSAPCIIFIDEIDAIGRRRGSGTGGGHDEREQTLNQLLTEMDGFGVNSGIVIMAATNRADVLDPALLRPGRFDRKVIIALPDVKGREDILRIHARNKRFADNVELVHIAKRTPGFSGADLENLLNEAALLAAREDRRYIEMHDIDEAVDRVLMGPAKKSKVITPEERRTIAYHEAGHVVAGLKTGGASIVQKVTIIPRGHAGGYALLLPEKETMLKTKQQFLDSMTVSLGGRIAEELTFNEITNGAHNDLQNVTRTARSMVTEYGMSKLGPIQFEQRGGDLFLGSIYGQTSQNYSDHMALKIDEEVAEIINGCYERTTEILKGNTELMTLIAETLLIEETLTKEQIDELVEKGSLEETNYGKGGRMKDEAPARETALAEATPEVAPQEEVPTEEI